MGAFTASLFGTLVLVAVPLLLLGAVSPWAMRLQAARSIEESGVGRRAAVRALDGRVAGRRVLRLAVGDRGDRDAAHVPRARRGAGAGRRRSARRALRCIVPVALLAALALPVGHDQARRRRPRALRDRDAVPVRAGGRGRRRHAQARAQRGPGDPLAVAARHGADRRLLGRLPGAAVRDRLAAARRRGSRRSARRAGRCRARTRTTSRTRAIDAVDIDPELFKIGHRYFGLQRAAAAARVRRRTRGRSCAAPTSATTRSSSTPTASPTSRST